MALSITLNPQVAQLSLTNLRDTLQCITAKGKILKQSHDHDHAYLGSDMSSFW